MTDETYPQAFGKYELLERIASGGMAEVFRARTFGIDGFQKPVAIKRLLPHISSLKDFTTMLSDEARTVVRLTHAHIVEVYDFDKVGESYYLAMEFVDGLDLGRLITQCQETNKKIPPEIAASIVRDVCRGLAYAHGRCDDEGKPMGIVHRDISPANILVSRSGEVKLADFGIAKAATNIHHTQEGILKGKLCYMAPEYARGEAPDRRSDLFSLGLVLYELLTLKRFFSGESQTEILKKVREARITESVLPTSLPEPLKKILCRAIAHDPAGRYASAEEFEEALTIYLSAVAPNLTATKLASFLKPFLGEEKSLSRPLAALAGIVPKSYQPIATQVLRNSSKMKQPLGWLMIFSGVMGDILKPILASLSSVLCLTSVVAAVSSFVILRKKDRNIPLLQKLESRAGMVFVFLSASSLMWAFITLLQFTTPQRGLLASAVPPVGNLQDLLANMAGQVAVIEKTTTEISRDVKDIKQAIESLKNQESVIASPKTPQEHYHNARLYQLRGMNQLAIDAYKKFIEMAPHYADAHLALQVLARDTPGAADLSGWYEGLSAKHPRDLTLKVMKIQWASEREQRITAMEALWKEHPDFPPVALFLGQDYYDKGWVAKTESYKGHMKELFDGVKKDMKADKLQAYFIDKESFERELEPMRAFDRYQSSMEGFDAKPSIDIRVEDTGSVFGISIIPKEAGVKKIYYGIDDPDPEIDTGTSPYLKDPITNEPMPNYQVTGSLSPGPHTIYAKYVDKDGKVSPIVSVSTENRPFRVLQSSLPGELGSSAVSVQVEFDPKEGKAFKYRYSLDQPSLNELTSETKVILTNLPRGTHKLFVKGVDPSGGETNTFEVPVEAN